jgi:phospholipid/cholesterol/gamma-HCH transport system substrate-binding protein
MMRRAAATAAAMVVLSGCGYRGAQSLPLPGAIGGSDTYQVTAVFADATTLVPRESCKSNDTVIGSVVSIELDEQLQARVVCSVKDGVTLPANSIATLRETSLLGERYVDFDPPAGVAARGRLQAGAVIHADSTHAVPDAEMVLGALSQLLNGGSLGSLQTISRELGSALSSSDLNGTARELEHAVSQLDEHRADIVHTLEAMDRLTSQLSRQRQVIGRTLDTVPGAVAVLDRQRPKIVQTLRALSALSKEAVPLIRDSKAATVSDLQHLAPVLEQLSKQSHQISTAIGAAITFPFPHNSRKLIKGDYGGMFGTIALDITSLNKLLALQATMPDASTTGGNPSATPPSSGSVLPDLGLGDVQGLLDGVLGVQNGTAPLNLSQLLGGGGS